MASRELNILIKAQNLTGRALASVKKDLGGLSKIGSTAAAGVGAASRNIQRGAVVAGAAIAYNIKQGIDSLAELQRVEAATGAVLKSTGNAAAGSAEDIRKRSEALEDLTTIDDKAIQNAQNLLLTFRNVGKDAFDPALQAAIDLNAALGGDEDSLQGVLIKVGRAVNDPIKGLTALTRSGVSFTEKQKEQIAALQESGDLLGAQKIILGELSKEFDGAAAAAADTYAGKMRRVGDAVEEAQMSLAVAFLPVLEKAGMKLSEFLQRPEVMKGIEDFGQSLASGFDKAIDFLGTVNWDAILGGLNTARGIAKTILDTFLSLPSWVQTAIVTGWGLNKLTGGAVGSIFGQLASGLIKGVLNMNAGVVNLKAATVIGGGAPGAPAAAGGKSLIGQAAKFILGPAAAVIIGSEIAAAVNKATIKPAATFERRQFKAVVDSKDISTIVHGLQAIEKQQNDPRLLEQTSLIASNIPFIGDALGHVGPKLEEQRQVLLAQLEEMGLTREQAEASVARLDARVNASLQAMRADAQNYATSEQQMGNMTLAEARAQVSAARAGVTATGQVRDAANTTAARTAEVAAATRAVAAKNWSPTVVANLTAAVTTNVSVDSVIRSVTSAVVSSGKGDALLGAIGNG